jgi:hypothetical protein
VQSREQISKLRVAALPGITGAVGAALQWPGGEAAGGEIHALQFEGEAGLRRIEHGFIAPVKHVVREERAAGGGALSGEQQERNKGRANPKLEIRDAKEGRNPKSEAVAEIQAPRKPCFTGAPASWTAAARRRHFKIF